MDKTALEIRSKGEGRAQNEEKGREDAAIAPPEKIIEKETKGNEKPEASGQDNGEPSRKRKAEGEGPEEETQASTRAPASASAPARRPAPVPIPIPFSAPAPPTTTATTRPAPAVPAIGLVFEEARLYWEKLKEVYKAWNRMCTRGYIPEYLDKAKFEAGRFEPVLMHVCQVWRSSADTDARAGVRQVVMALDRALRETHREAKWRPGRVAGAINDMRDLAVALAPRGHHGARVMQRTRYKGDGSPCDLPKEALDAIEELLSKIPQYIRARPAGEEKRRRIAFGRA